MKRDRSVPLRFRRWRLVLAPLLAVILLSVMSFPAHAALKIAPDFECEYATNYVSCSQTNYSAHGPSTIHIDMIAGDGQLDALGYVSEEGACFNTCLYDVVAMTTSISGVPVRRVDLDCPCLNIDSGRPQRPCSGSHTVWVDVEWRVIDGSTQGGTYRTKNLTMNCSS